MKQFLYQSPIGKYYLVSNSHALIALSSEKMDFPMVKTLEDEILKRTVKELDEYFAGKRRKFTIPLALEGTSFQKKVWQALLNIPFGKTISYKELAMNIKNEKAIRAVGGANGKNPVSIIVPCHRVIAADGTLGGYSDGLPKKVKLLMMEGVKVKA